jgi:ribA/ribD-fused uncharacterized protein
LNDEQLLADLRARFNAGEKLKFVFFWGHRPGKNGISASCFSQWYEAPFTVDGERFPTAEHFMMARKAALFEDWPTRAQVLGAPNPGAAKAFGREVRGFDEAVWRQHRFAIVCAANEAKFTQNPELRDFLIKTGSRVLVEASPVDRVWGIGLAQDDERASDPNLWQGLNLLGFALMHVREDLSPP